MLSNYPKVLKYAIDDRVYTFREVKPEHEYADVTSVNGNGITDGACKRVKITGWRTVVTDSNGDGTGTPIQTSYYTVKEITGYSSPNYLIAVELYSDFEYELPSGKLFSSMNHLLSVAKGKYINSPFGNLADNGYLYFSKTGMLGYNNVSNGDWIDWAGMNFAEMDFSEIVYNDVWAGGYNGGELGGTKSLIFDNCNLTGATLKSGISTRGQFIAGIFSYDAETTIFTDGYPVGMPLSGKVAGASGGSTLTGIGTSYQIDSSFLTELEVGAIIEIYNLAGTFTVASIESNTSLTVEETFPITFGTRFYSRHNGI